MSLRVALIGALSVFFLAGCGNSRENPADGRYRFLHAAPTLGTSGFLLEERLIATLNYTDGNGSTLLDSGPFDFNVETPSLVSATNERTVRLAATIVAGHDHTFVLFDDTGSPALVEYARPFVEVSGTNAGLEILHAFSGGPRVDLYIEVDGADLAAATPRGTLTFKQILDPFTVPSGSYRLSATEPGNPANVFYQSTVFALADGSQALIGVFGDAGIGTGLIRAAIANSTASASVSLPDALSPSELRTIHAATTAGPLDVVSEGDFMNPLHASIAFGEISSYAPVPNGESALQVTPAGDPGVLEIDDTLNAATGTRLTQIINGEPGALTAVILNDNNRGRASRALYRVRHGGQLLPTVDLYLAPPGTGPDITDLQPVAIGLFSGGGEFLSTVLPGEVELLVVENDQDATTADTNIIAGPVPVAMADGRVYDIVLLDSATAGTLDVVVSDETGQ